MDKVYCIKCKYLKNRHDMHAYECKHPDHKYSRDVSDFKKEEIYRYNGNAEKINKSNDCRNFERCGIFDY